MVDYKKEACKDDSPERTIRRIKRILSGFGISLVEENLKSTSNTFTTKLFFKDTDLGSQGKGVTKNLSRASAYGEFIERLQNMILADPFHRSHDVLSAGKFRLAPDEKKLTIDEIKSFLKEFAHIYSIPEKRFGKKDLRSFSRWFSVSPGENAYIALPFYSLIDGKTRDIPWQVLSLYRSNGMCAGNNAEEALVQGLSEILERYVNKIAITENIAPPDIPMRYIKRFRRSAAIISEIERTGQYKVLVKDFSLGKKLPVVGIVLISLRNQSYMVNFGAHPNFAIAVERCLTEALQSYKLDMRLEKSLLPFSFLTNPLPGHVNFTNSVRVGRGHYPGVLFLEKADYIFSPWEDHVDDNRILLQRLLKLIRDMGLNVLVRDWSVLGFPTFQILVPGISEVEDIPSEFLDFSFARTKAGDIIRNMQSASKKDCLFLISYITSRLPYIMDCRSLSGFLNFPVRRESPFDVMNVPIFLARLRFKMGDIGGACSILNSVLRQISADAPLYLEIKCTRDYLFARKSGVSLVAAKVALNKFYSSSLVTKVISEWKSSMTVFEDFPVLPCMDCSKCRIKTYCLRNYFANLYLEIKERMSVKPINQEELKRLSLI